VLLSAEGRAYTRRLVNALPVGRIEPLTGRLTVIYTLSAPLDLQKKRWDIANREKVLSDACTRARVWLDDSQIDDLRIVRGPYSDPGHVDIYIISR